MVYTVSVLTGLGSSTSFYPIISVIAGVIPINSVAKTLLSIVKGLAVINTLRVLTSFVRIALVKKIAFVSAGIIPVNRIARAALLIVLGTGGPAAGAASYLLHVQSAGARLLREPRAAGVPADVLVTAVAVIVHPAVSGVRRIVIRILFAELVQ